MRWQKITVAIAGLHLTTSHSDTPTRRGAPVEAPLSGMELHGVCMCSVWHGLRRSLGSLSVEEGKSTFGIMAGIWAKF